MFLSKSESLTTFLLIEILIKGVCFGVCCWQGGTRSCLDVYLNTLAKPRPNCPSPPVMRVRGAAA